MSLLAIEVDPSGVAAVVEDRRGHRELRGDAEPAPEELWQAVLGAAQDALGDGPVVAVELTTAPAWTLLWDRDTLGSPRRALTDLDAGPALARLRDAEPHTWALVEADRYAVGPLDSYLLARMTRGLEHATSLASAERTGLLDPATGDWSTERCARFGVPLDALPELVTEAGAAGTTDPRTFLSLEVPIRLS